MVLEKSRKTAKYKEQILKFIVLHYFFIKLQSPEGPKNKFKVILDKTKENLG